MYKIIEKSTTTVMRECETLENARLALLQCEAYDLFFKMFVKDSYTIEEREETEEEKKMLLSIISKLRECGIVGKYYNVQDALFVLRECVMSASLQRIFILYEGKVKKQLTIME